MDALGIDLWKLIVQIIAFLIFIFLLWKFALGPITRMLDERQERVRESMEAAQRMQDELKATATRNEEALATARQQAQEILADARKVGDAAIARAKEDADRQAEEYMARAQATLRAETEQARQQLRTEVANLAVAAASQIVRKELDPAAQARLIEETLAEATSGKPAAGSES